MIGRNHRSASPRKAELTPLIDVIFLLLIFFLVTMRIIPSSAGRGLREGSYAVRALNAVDDSRGQALVVLKWLETGGGVAATYYAALTNRPVHGNWTRSQLWNRLRAAATTAHLQTIQNNSPFQFYWGSAGSDIEEAFRNVSEVLIIAGPDNGHEFSFGEVNEVIRYCRRPGSTVTRWFVLPEPLSSYDYGVSGFQFQNLPLRRVYRP